jgi:hypothetical protein
MTEERLFVSGPAAEVTKITDLVKLLSPQTVLCELKEQAGRYPAAWFSGGLEELRRVEAMLQPLKQATPSLVVMMLGKTSPPDQPTLQMPATVVRHYSPTFRAPPGPVPVAKVAPAAAPSTVPAGASSSLAPSPPPAPARASSPAPATSIVLPPLKEAFSKEPVDLTDDTAAAPVLPPASSLPTRKRTRDEELAPAQQAFTKFFRDVCSLHRNAGGFLQCLMNGSDQSTRVFQYALNDVCAYARKKPSWDPERQEIFRILSMVDPVAAVHELQETKVALPAPVRTWLNTTLCIPSSHPVHLARLVAAMHLLGFPARSGDAAPCTHPQCKTV